MHNFCAKKEEAASMLLMFEENAFFKDWAKLAGIRQKYFDLRMSQREFLPAAGRDVFCRFTIRSSV